MHAQLTLFAYSPSTSYPLSHSHLQKLLFSASYISKLAPSSNNTFKFRTATPSWTNAGHSPRTTAIQSIPSRVYTPNTQTYARSVLHSADAPEHAWKQQSAPPVHEAPLPPQGVALGAGGMAGVTLAARKITANRIVSKRRMSGGPEIIGLHLGSTCHRSARLEPPTSQSATATTGTEPHDTCPEPMAEAPAGCGTSAATTDLGSSAAVGATFSVHSNHCSGLVLDRGSIWMPPPGSGEGVGTGTRTPKNQVPRWLLCIIKPHIDHHGSMVQGSKLRITIIVSSSDGNST
ncbi:hypothetical protein DFH09DRAFT_1115897 [Mycena vulgaris]|nr:hypothetical protein DFH09DRAFT_1115897 [Mycena vulgaris]